MLTSRCGFLPYSNSYQFNFLERNLGNFGRRKVKDKVEGKNQRQKYKKGSQTAYFAHADISDHCST